MAYARWGVLVCAAAGALCACSISPTLGETLSECSDRQDNDEDGVTDCRDPDCQALSECAAAARIRTPAMPGQISDAYVAEPPDARTPPMQEPVDASMPDEPRDASAAPDALPEPPEPGCPDGCGANQTCVVDQCVDDVLVVAELWDITRIEVSVPRSVEEGGWPCLEPGTSCIFIPTLVFPRCGCAPDPQVQFWVDHDTTDDKEAELAGETDPVDSRDETEWPSSGVPAPGITLPLLPNSEIQVKVVDDDATRDELMFECPVAADVVTGGGPIECKRMFPPGEEAVEFFVRAHVAPGQAPPPE
jgi:hypothetical protein